MGLRGSHSLEPLEPLNFTWQMGSGGSKGSTEAEPPVFVAKMSRGSKDNRKDRGRIFRCYKLAHRITYFRNNTLK